MNKLYTEEQMKEAIKNGYLHFFDDTNRLNLLAEEYMNSLTPIELPTDEEIGQEFKYSSESWEIRQALEEGAKWLRDKIKGGNK